MKRSDFNHGLWGCDKPIVVTYGQTSSGKTTALVRLIKYLKEQVGSDEKCAYELCYTFHDHYYPNVPFSQIENFFETQLKSPINDIKGNADAFFCNIKHKGDVVCRFLESPGENLFALKEASEANIYRDNGFVIEREFQYLVDIMNSKYKKIWVFFMDPGFTKELKDEKPAYIERINQIVQRIGANDNIIFVVNKDDLVTKKYAPILKEGGYKGYVNLMYDGILSMEPFTTRGFLGNKKEHFKIVPFSAYKMTPQGLNTDGSQKPILLEMGDPSYPKELWKTIQDAINNRF